jgi:hypothetical protein
LASVLLKPRALTAPWVALTWATWRFGASRRASGMLDAPERRMSSPVMIWMA